MDPLETPLTTASRKAAGSYASKAMRLHAPTKNFRVERVMIAARLAGVKLSFEPASVAACETLHGGAARSLVLETPHGTLTQSNSVLRYIANLAPASELYGATGYEEALVDQWIEFAALELEVLVVALISGDGACTSKLPVGMSEDMKRALGALDSVLARRTFLVGERLTIADIALITTCRPLFAHLVGAAERKTLPNLVRWFLTCANQPAFVAELGAVELEEMKSAAAPIPSGFLPSGSQAGKSGQPAGAKAAKPVAAPARCFKRTRTRVKELLAQGAGAIGSKVTVKGWVRTCRPAEKNTLAFVELNDGSCAPSIQIVVPKGVAGDGLEAVTGCGGAGASLSIDGVVKESIGAGQAIEVVAESATVLGAVYGGEKDTIGAKGYPLAKKFHSAEHLRTHAHLRARSRLHSSVMRVRHAMAYATHKFFHEQGFLYVHTPLITAADCEGAGEQFSVTTLLPDDPKEPIKRTKAGEIDYTQDFFGTRTSLTVSGQLNVETHACALSDCYTFGPTFRAENSHTTRHLAEFWMIEPEVCFAELKDDIDLAEDYLKFCVHYALENCNADLEYFEEQQEVSRLGLRVWAAAPHCRGRQMIQHCLRSSHVHAVYSLVLVVAVAHRFFCLCSTRVAPRCAARRVASRAANRVANPSRVASCRVARARRARARACFARASLVRIAAWAARATGEHPRASVQAPHLH